jgi:signal transduction histidine kinase
VELPEVRRAYEMALSGDIDDENSPEVQQARDYLRQTFAPMLQSYEKVVGQRFQLHFHLPNSRSLVRLSRDKQTRVDGQWVDISDDLTAYRATVVFVNNTGMIATGIELGSQGLAVRGVIPVFAEDGQQIGSAEVLQEIEPILDAAISDDQGDLALYVRSSHMQYSTEEETLHTHKGDFVRVVEPKTINAEGLVTPELLAKGSIEGAFVYHGYIALAAFPLLDYQGEQLGVFVYEMDTETVLRHANTAKITLTITLAVLLGFGFFMIFLSSAKNRAETANVAKSDFLSRMSHEMRTPLNAIIGMASIGASSANIERKQYSLEKISSASAHLLGVINDILDMSKIEADKLEPFSASFSPRTMLENIVDVMQFKIDEKKQQFIVELAEELPAYVIGDEQRITQIITNLLSNATKFTPEQGIVSLKATAEMIDKQNVAIRIEVSDTGIGISEAEQARLFNPFEQANSSIFSKYGGTGLGLAISRRIAEIMGGEISVKSTLGKGSSFTLSVSLPIAQDCAHEVGKSKQREGIFTGKRIILAEDVAINREIIATFLEETGIEITMAYDGKAAVELFCAKPEGYNLILMDIQMPNMDGEQATRKIRSSGLANANIPILALTANAFHEDTVRYMSIGMNGHLTKPIAADALIDTLRTYLL